MFLTPFAMRYKTLATALLSAFCVGEISSAIFSKCIQGAIAEQAVKGFCICTLVTRKIFAIGILKKRIVTFFHQGIRPPCLIYCYTFLTIDAVFQFNSFELLNQLFTENKIENSSSCCVHQIIRSTRYVVHP